MIRSQRFMVAVVGALLLSPAAQAAPLPGDRTALQEVPGSVPLVIHLRGIEGTAERALHLLAQVDAGHAKQARDAFNTFLANGHEGRKLRGLAKDGPIFVLFTELPKPGDELSVAVVAAVTSYKEFRDNLLTEKEREAIKKDDAGVESTDVQGRTIHFLERKGFAVVTPSKDAAGLLARRAAGLDRRISPELGGKLLAADLGVYLSMDAVNKAYGDQIKAARALAEAGLQTILDQIGKDKNPGLEMAQKMIGPAFQAVEDSQGLLLTVELRPTGLNLHAQTELKAGSVSSKALAEVKVSAFKELAQLPAGQMFYTGLQPSPVLFKALGSVVFGVLAAADSEAAKKVQAAVTALVEAGPGTRADCASIPVEGLQVWHFKEPEAAVAAQLKLVEALASGTTFQQGQLKEKPVIKKNAEKYGDFEFHSIKLVWDLEKMLGPQAEQLPEEARKKMAEAMKKMLGEGTMVYIGTDGKQYLQMTARDWTAARKLLDGYLKQKKAVDDTGNFKAVRKELPAQATLLGVVDLVRYGAAIVGFTRPFLGDQFNLPANYPAALPNAAPSFIGMALTLQPTRGAVDLHFSALAMKDAYTAFVRPWLAVQAQGPLGETAVKRGDRRR